MVESDGSGRELFAPGGMAEWTKAAVLKTAVGQPTGGSNPSPSARQPNAARGGAGVAERGRLLSACRGKYLYRGFESLPPRHMTGST
jgi:hypothetical protein